MSRERCWSCWLLIASAADWEGEHDYLARCFGDCDQHADEVLRESLERHNRAIRALARHALELRQECDKERRDADRFYKAAHSAVCDGALGVAQALARAERAERERDAARAALREALDLAERAAFGTPLRAPEVDAIARLRALLPCSPCPGRSARDCPAGEHCRGTVAP